jgi:hypothetical protein
MQQYYDPRILQHGYSLTHAYDLCKYHKVFSTARTTTPLKVAVIQGHEKVVEALLAAKADASLANQVQHTALAPNTV